MFNWFRKNKKQTDENLFQKQDTLDSLEESLWEIKDEFDLPTEEIANVVQSKRKNFDYIHQVLEKKPK
jgi:molybdopterin converting factor small subunit|tara:strand:+ start:2575 stop:2778 length:204 start_codon:yes stop_codon:yes gene_type:complete